jgi:hypothetical protein
VVPKKHKMYIFAKSLFWEIYSTPIVKIIF